MENTMSDTTKRPSEIFQNGMDARARGELATACPYADEGWDREQWLEGWRKPDDIEQPPEMGFA